MIRNTVTSGARFVLKFVVGLSAGLAFLYTIVIISFFIPASSDDFLSLLRSLPSDEEMIAHFSKHRADFERLAHIYREDLSVPTSLGILGPTAEIQAIMDRINVTAVRGDNVLWMPPDPYSHDPVFVTEKAKLEPKWYSPESRKFSGVIFSFGHLPVLRLKYMEPVSKAHIPHSFG